LTTVLLESGRAQGQPGSGQAPAQISGVVHEAKPTETQMVAGARITISGGELAGKVFETDSLGAFTLGPVTSAGFALEVTKAGYEVARLSVKELPHDARLAVAMLPEPRTITLNRSGRDDCADLPAPPQGVPGLREYARVAVHHDGHIVVNAAHLPFSSNEGFVYRLTPSGWQKNELDYILIRTPVPVLGGFVYSIAFGGGKDLCGPWSLDATHPN
jgi:hypothetical protein